MKRARITNGLWACVLGGVLFVLGGCVDEEVVFRDRPLFEEPSDVAASFLGYSDQEEGLTTCGNCHVGMQAGWETTGHAHAWETLEASGSSQEFCEGCHTVNELGNTVEGDAGWTATDDPRYHDVQCESCHGPGLDHVEDPDATQPLANFAVGADLETGCGECHQGAHHPFVEQWESSAHGAVPAQGSALNVGAFCLPCHEGRTALSQQFGESTDYVEKDGDPQPITCATCHDPHGSDFAANLRAPIDEASSQHLCVRCHSRTGTPSLGSPNQRGPHAFQGLLVLGEDVGWIPPNSDLSDAGQIVSTHGTDANSGLCATCHVSRSEITDSETGEFLVQSVGHTFEPIPCLDEDGLPREGCTLAERNFDACATSGCHGTAEAARSAMTVVRTRLNNLLDELWDDTNDNAVLETTDGGLLPQVLAQEGSAEIDPFDSNFTTAEGALWNAQLAWTNQRPHWGSGQVEGQTDSFGAHKGSGEGVHNPFLLEALLAASINAVENEYGLSASVSTQVEAERPPGVTLR